MSSLNPHTQVEVSSERTESGMFLFAVVSSLLVVISVNGFVLKTYPSIDVYSNMFVWAYTTAMCIPIFAYVLWIKKPLSVFGITLHNWKSSLLESLIISGVLLSLGILALIIIGASEGKTLGSFIQFGWLKFETLSYIPHSVVQEFVFRGVVLTTLLHLFQGKPLWQPLLLSTLLFSFPHIHLGLSTVGLTFLVGILFGWMYLRHGNILGISLVHIALGTFAFLFGFL